MNTTPAVISPKKLIEVALPLDAINVAAAREKSIRHGHPSTLHLWWARRPLAAARAVIFAQLVHDPEDLWRCQNPGVEPNQQVRGHWTKARAKLFKIIEELVLWENTSKEAVLKPAREAIRQSWRETCELNKGHPQAMQLFNLDKMPGLHDPFAGGGSIPLEAQRLGLDAYASDLNPVAVLINKAMIEIPPIFAGKPPVHPEAEKSLADWGGAAGLAEDVRRYGQWMRDEAFKRIGHLYTPIEVTKAMAKDRPDLTPYVGDELPVIAWLSARTVKSPNPAFSKIDVPLASTFVLSSKPGKEAYVHPILDKAGYRFSVRIGKPPETAKAGTSAGKRQAFRCLMSNVPMDYEYIRAEGKANRMGHRLIAAVLEGKRSRLFIAPTEEMEKLAASAVPIWKPDCEMPKKHRNFQPPVYGMNNLGDLFSPRQLVMLNTFSDLVGEVRERIKHDSMDNGNESNRSLADGGSGIAAYADAVSVYLGEIVSKITSYHCTLGIWRASDAKSGRAFGRQAIPMVWDYPECNPFAGAGGDWDGACNDCAKVLATFPVLARGNVWQAAAQNSGTTGPSLPIISP